jgi:hypothetical protein
MVLQIASEREDDYGAVDIHSLQMIVLTNCMADDMYMVYMSIYLDSMY